MRHITFTFELVTKLAISVSFVTLLNSCSAVHYIGKRLNSQDTLCTPAAAYGQGHQDGQRKLAFNSHYAANCPTNNIQINNAYRNGYIAGQANQH